jgi:hypothetical protein
MRGGPERGMRARPAATVRPGHSALPDLPGTRTVAEGLPQLGDGERDATELHEAQQRPLAAGRTPPPRCAPALLRGNALFRLPTAAITIAIGVARAFPPGPTPGRSGIPTLNFAVPAVPHVGTNVS